MSRSIEQAFEDLWPCILDEIDMKSSPGSCVLARYGATNGEILKYDPFTGMVDAQRVELVKSLVLNRIYEVRNFKSNQDPILQGICDPIKLFIKPEPHKLKKIEDGRLRLISSVSLIDSCVDRFLFIRLSYKMVQIVNDLKTPVMVGWSPFKGGHLLMRHGWENVKEFVCIDKSAWDWSIPPWMINMMKEIVKRLSDDAPEWWDHMVDVRFDCLFGNPEFIFSDFGRVRQGFPGIMKSGCYLTILLNSVGQLILHAVTMAMLGKTSETMAILPKVLGDDSVQPMFPYVDDYVSIVEQLGFSCKVEKLGYIDFAGYKYKDFKFYPAYKNKHVFRLQHLTDQEDVMRSTLVSYQIMYVFDEEFLDILQGITRLCGFPDCVVDRQRLLALANGTM